MGTYDFLKTHDSLDDPPDKPFFNGQRKSASPGNTQTESLSKRSHGVSSGRRVNIRSELIDQFKKCQDLVDSGAINAEVFDDLHCNILADLKNF